MAVHSGIAGRRRERMFYIAMAILVVATVFAGFAPTFYLRPYFATAPLPPLLHLHGLIFTSWILLFLVQTTLIAGHRVNLHRRLGILGGVIASLMFVVGTTTAVIRAKQGAAPPGVPPLAFLTVPLFDMLVFPILVIAGFYYRRRPDVHKRLMTLATISLLAAAVARLPHVISGGPLAFFGLTDLFILVCVIYDFISRGRVHRATVWGGLLIIASQPLRLIIGGTHAWITFATWLTQVVPWG